MSGTVLEGVGVTMVAGLMSGNCMLPMKFARRWNWENIWLVFSIVSLLVLPWTLAFALVNRLLDVYRIVPVTVMYAPLVFGAGWGVAQILFGISCNGSAWASVTPLLWGWVRCLAPLYRFS